MQRHRDPWVPVLQRLLIVAGAALLIREQYLLLGGGVALALVISIWANGRSAARTEASMVECLRQDGARLRRYTLRCSMLAFVLLELIFVAAGAVDVISQLLLIPGSALTGALTAWMMWASTLR
jgi:hypothetical protein